MVTLRYHGENGYPGGSGKPVQVGALALALMLPVAACGSSKHSANGGPTGATAQSSTNSAASNADLEGTIRIGTCCAPAGWDPDRSVNQNGERPYLTQVYDRLIFLASDDSLQPMLATKWDFSSDGLTLTMTLRSDVTYQDGSKFDASNAKANLERAKTLPDSTVAGQLANVTGVDAPDPTTLVLHLKQPDQTLLYILSSTTGAMISQAGLTAADIKQKPYGSGLYKLVSVTQDRAILERNDSYWDAKALAVAPKHKEIVGVTDETAKVNALQSGELDMASINTQSIPRVQDLVKNQHFQLQGYSGVIDYELFLNAAIPPLDNPDVRRALNLAIDRNAIASGLMAGYCDPVSQQFGKGLPGHVDGDDKVFPYGGDVAMAKDLLQKAGVGPFTVKAIVPAGFQPQQDLGTIIQEQLSKIGVTVQLVGIPGPQATPTFRQGGYGIEVLNVSAVTPDVSSVIGTYYLGPLNPAGTKALPAGFADKANAAKGLKIGSPQLDSAYKELSQELLDQPLHVPVCSAQAMWAGSSKVIGLDKLSGTRSVFQTADTRFVGIAKK
jgi:peptide/nickel transport system substrate-binding protein